MHLGPKMAPPGGHIFYIGLYREKHRKIFLFETIGLRALIFGFKHHLVDLYQVCSNYAPGAKIAPHHGRQRHGQLSTDTYMLALNKTQVSALGLLGPLVYMYHAIK